MASQEEYSAACRVRDAHNLHVLARAEIGTTGPESVPYIGIQIGDGSSSGQLYDNREDCARIEVHRDQYIFPLAIQREHMTLAEAWVVLSYARQAKSRGVAFHHEEPFVAGRLDLLAPHIPRVVDAVSNRYNMPRITLPTQGRTRRG